MKQFPNALKGIILFSTFFLLLLLAIRCEDEKPVIREYPRITGTSVMNISDSGATFSADLYSLGTEVTLEYGFLWGVNKELYYGESNKIILGKPQGTGPFTADIRSGLIKEQQYTLKPFAKTEDRIVYGPSSEFKSLGSNAPIIYKFSPDSAAWGDTVRISGKNFSFVSGTNIVKLNQISCQSVKSTDTTLFFVVAPEVQDLKNFISVELAGNVAYYTKDTLKLITPRIKDFIPKQAYWGDTISIYGTHFRYFGLLPGNIIKIGSFPCSLVQLSDTLIKFKLPYELNVKSSSLIMTINGFTVTGPGQFTLLPPFFSFSPTKATWGNIISLNGRFNTIVARNTVYFNNTRATISSVSATKMRIMIPYNLTNIKSAIKYSVTPFTTEAVDSFLIASPEITSFSPINGWSGTTVTIKGRYFSSVAATSVKFGTIYTQITSINDTVIVAKVPNGVNGPVKITVNSSTLSCISSEDFQVFVPVISGINPQSGTFNDEVTITGTNLIQPGSSTTVIFNGVRATIKSLSSNSIVVNVPLTIDSIPQIIAVYSGTNYSITTQEFILNRPEIFSVSSGTFLPGQDITISGKDFNPSAMYNKVFWGSDPLVVKSATTTEIVATIPNLPRGDNRIKVVTGRYSVFSLNTFKVNSSWLRIPVPEIVTSHVGLGDFGEQNYGGSLNGYGYIFSKAMYSATYKFDPATNSMVNLNIPFPTPSGTYCSFLHMGQVNCKNNFYLIAGRGNGDTYIYSYNPILNSWKSSIISDPGPIRVPGISFGLNDKIYFGLNYDNANKNFWEYNPDTNIWTRLSDFPGTPSYPYSTYFSMNNKGYVVFSDNQVWKFDPDLLIWTRKSDFPGQRRKMSVSFALNGFGYMGTGLAGSTALNDMWKYDPDTDIWTSIPGLPSARSSAVAFTINNKAYLGYGKSYQFYDLSDFYEFDPTFIQK